MSDQNENIILAAEITAAWLGNPNTRAGAEEVPAFLTRMFQAVSELEQPQGEQVDAPQEEAFTPAVSVRKSLANPDQIISMIDGKPYKTLRRHLATNGLTPEEYRQRYGLKADYPMTAPSYSEARRDMAKKIGLGRKPARQAAAPEAKDVAAPGAPKRGRRKQADG